MALAFLTGKPGPRIVGISPLVKTQFKIWDRAFVIPGLTVTQREHFRAAVDFEVLTASVPPPSMGIATDLRSRLLLTLAPSIDPCFIIGALSGLRGVELVEPVPALYGPARGHLTDIPRSDSAFATLKVTNDEVATWMHTLTARPDEWDSVQTANIAILDSGALDTHPIFGDNGFGNGIIKPDHDWFPRDLTDKYGHGTHVASEIVGRDLGPNLLGLPKGVLPQSQALCFNIFRTQPNSNGDFEINISAFYTALYTIRLKQRVAVINMSIWMKDEPSETILREFAKVDAAGIVIVACAGNNFDGTTNLPLGKDSAYRVLYPARLPNILSVGAINGSSLRAEFSRFSSWNTNGRDGNDYFAKDAGRWPLVDVVAPGVKVWGAAAATGTLITPHRTDGNFGAVRLKGTSMAAPYVTAGIAAIRVSPKWASASAEEVRQLVRTSVAAIPGQTSLFPQSRELFGTGLLDYAALITNSL